MRKKIYSLFFICMLFSTTVFSQINIPYKNANLSSDKRAEDLLSRLTLEEKIGLMQNSSLAVERLGIKKYDWWNEALHGVARAGYATVFPQTIGMAASFDDSLLYKVFDAISTEARAKYNKKDKDNGSKKYQGLTFWTPNINIFRDPRWGRGQETYGEDPYLTTKMGIAVVKGLQGPKNTKYIKAQACAKHFAVHSGPEWNRHRFDVKDLNPRYLWGTYLPAFEALVKKADVKEVMCAYNSVSGEPCCGNKHLLMQILRNDWDYKGIIVSDCGAISDFYKKGHHETHKDAFDASTAAIKTSTDLNCGNTYIKLKDAVNKIDKETKEKINESVKRLLKARFELGEMDPDSLVSWSKIPYSELNSKEHKELALKIAHESMVLLQNKNNILPLSKDGGKIAVIGPNAADSAMQNGNYNGTPFHTITILKGIEEKTGNTIYDKGCSIVTKNENERIKEIKNFNKVLDKIKDIKTVIFVGGISPKYEGEEMKVSYPGFKGGDRTNIELPEIQKELLKTLKKNGKKIILVNCSGSAIAFKEETKLCDGILQAWYPGEQGGRAVADVLFGDYNPAGRLPVTFYSSTKQLPPFEEYSMKGRTYRYMKEKPLFPFGFGLSYTSFKYSKATVNNRNIKKGESVKLSFKIENTGEKDGDEVAQIYLKKKGDKEGANLTLRSFKRIFIKSGETKEISFNLSPDELKWYDPKIEMTRIIEGQYEIFYGSSSDSHSLKKLKLTISK